MDRKSSINFSRDLLETYNVWCKPLCKEIQMPKTAFDILMFLANNPDYNTARDIVEIRGLKANLVSVNVDKIVNEGFLERIPDAKDRRKNMLKCTNKANPVIEKGRQLQKDFFGRVFDGIDEENLRQFYGVLEQLRTNIDTMRKEGK